MTLDMNSSKAGPAGAQPASSAALPFQWPEGKRAAVSLTFDDARLSQADVGLPLLNRYEARATFYVSLENVEQRLEGWREAAEEGHEIGNHTLSHPCSGNFPWSRANALEDYTLERMRGELDEANRRLDDLLGVTPTTFAYPCGQTFVGRGRAAQSYVPLVAEMFMAGRGWPAECANEPRFCDLSQLMGMSCDAATFEQLRPILEDARENGRWLIFAGHEIGQSGRLATHLSTLERLLEYAQAPENGLWLAPVATVASYVLARRMVE